MAVLYPLAEQAAHVDPVHGRFEPDAMTGGFPFPDEVSDAQQRVAVKGRRQWETEEERAERLNSLELARRRDPASALTALEENTRLTRQVTDLMARLAERELAPRAAVPDDRDAELTALRKRVAELEAAPGTVPDGEPPPAEELPGAARKPAPRAKGPAKPPPS